MNRTSVQPGTLSRDGGKHLIDIGIVDRPDTDDAAFGIGDGNAAVMEAADKVHRPVNGVNDKELLCIQAVPLIQLLTEKVCVRQFFAKPLYEQFLYTSVILRHDIPLSALHLCQNPVGVHDQLRGFSLDAFDESENRAIVFHAIVHIFESSV